MHLQDRVVLLTGASDGIGAALVTALRSTGAKLSLTARSPEKLARHATPEDLVTPLDLTEPDSAQLLVTRTLERFGRLDVLINNAGCGIYWPLADTPEPESRAMFDLNFFAPLRLTQAAIVPMRRQRDGLIVNVGSIAGRVALPWMPVYSATKSALAAVTESLRIELKKDGVRAMLVSPGYILTGFHDHARGLAPPAKVVEGKRFAITPEECARDIVRGIQRDARTVVTPPWAWFLIALHCVLPRAVEAHLARLNTPIAHS